jgi:hypothetical protein
MLSGKLLAIITLIWIMGLLLGSTFSYNNTTITWTGSSTDQTIIQGKSGQLSDVQFLTNFNNAISKTEVLGFIPLPTPNGNYFKVFFSVFTLRFSFLVSNPYGEMFWYIFLLPFSIMGVWGCIYVLLSIIRGNFSWG